MCEIRSQEWLIDDCRGYVPGDGELCLPRVQVYHQHGPLMQQAVDAVPEERGFAEPLAAAHYTTTSLL